ncbi:MAG: cyclic nucleotide-binding domain-containing protein [candidate division Zixibacteria bacterium]|nr:cyclic nucleotide-binding domain-containing protein [candidate division Zixibacteria bacterium]
MSQDADLSFLKTVILFEGLTAEQIEKIAAIMSKETIPAHSDILQEGEKGTRMYIIQEGTAEVSRTLTLKVTRNEFGQKEKTFIQLGPGFFFGEMALLENDVRSATVTTITNCTLFIIEQDHFNGLCEAYPEIGYKILRNIARTISGRLRRTNQDVLKLTTALRLALTR